MQRQTTPRIRHALSSRILAVLALTLTPQAAMAASFDYFTDGWVEAIDSTQGPPLISFMGLNSTYSMGQQSIYGGLLPLQLGAFRIEGPMSTKDVIYDHVPFEIEVRVPSLDGVTVPTPPNTQFTPVEGSIRIDGYLNGDLSSVHPSSLVATLQSLQLGSISDGSNVIYTFPIPLSDLKIPPDKVLLPPWPLESSSLTEASYSADVVPEPSMAFVFLTSIGALALWRRQSSHQKIHLAVDDHRNTFCTPA